MKCIGSMKPYPAILCEVSGGEQGMRQDAKHETWGIRYEMY